MKLSVIVCILGYVVLKLMVRRVWFREEHLRPGYFRHWLILHSVDFSAILFLVAVFFMLLATRRLALTLLVTALLISYDLALREFFFVSGSAPDVHPPAAVYDAQCETPAQRPEKTRVTVLTSLGDISRSTNSASAAAQAGSGWAGS